MSLTPRERALLKARAHALEPIVQIGQSGLSEAVVREIEHALKVHGLIKIRAGGGDRTERGSLFRAICERTDAAPVQHVGKVLVLWRPISETPEP